jgi:oligopeptide transport system ATP-binding protein
MTALLEVNNLRVSYHTYAGEVQSVRGVSFNVNKSEAVAIVGESGCGKTVTAKSIMGLIQCPPGEIKKGSSILFNGKNILEYDEKKMKSYRGSEVGMIFQDPMTSLNPTMKVGRQIAEGIQVHKGLSKKDAFNEAVNMLKTVGIPNADRRANQYPHEFSGGMRQRAMIAMAMSCAPKLLIADEPTTALDVTIQAQIIDLMKNLQINFGTAVLIITHDLGVVADIAQNVIVMYAGQIVEKGTTEDIFYNPKHPYTWSLLKSVPRLDSSKENDLMAIPGTPPDLLAPPVGCPFTARCSYCMTICEKMAPPVTNISAEHIASCWLHHSYAPAVDFISGEGSVHIGR